MKKFVIALFLSFFLISCSNDNKTNLSTTNITKDEYQEFIKNKKYIDDLPNEDLKKPNKTISNLDDFIYVLDYLAFYRISDEIYFEIADDYAKTFYNPYQEYVKAYKEADLADVYNCVFKDDYYTKYQIISLKYSISKDIATNKPSYISNATILKNYDYKATGGFSLNMDNKEEIDCETSEQLYYLVMNGYNPKPKDGSMALVIYNKAKEVIHDNISDDMDDFEKIMAIYDYLTYEIYYDKSTAYSSSNYLVKEQAYYLEGVFLNKCAVCDGKAKAYALLLNMLGIKCYRQTGKNGDADHAWNIVNYNDNWYVSCTTYGQPSEFKLDDKNLIVPNHSMMLTSKDTPSNEWGYIPEKHTNILISNTEYDIFSKIGNGKYKISNIEAFDILYNEIKNNDLKNKKIEFIYVGDFKEEFQNELIKYFDDSNNINILAPKTINGQIYEVIFY